MATGSMRLHYLFEQYFQKTASAAERAELAKLLEQHRYREEAMALFADAWEKYQGEQAFFSEQQSAAMLEKILGTEPAQAEVAPFEKPHKITWWRLTAAAAVLLLALAVWYIVPVKKEDSIVKNNSIPATVLPQPNNAVVLTLENGEQVILDSAANGFIAQQGGSSIIKEANGLSYQAGDKVTATGYNTITTPYGSTYSNIILSDGSKVWLDAGSSIRFPVVFTGKERMVEITGQVWLDVVHNEKMPFKVKTKGIEINDLGTQFNVNAYDDEPTVNVTLLEGLLSIDETLLKPGQQAQVQTTGNTSINIIDNAAMDEVLAWKNNVFRFKQTDLKTILRQAKRWYDIEVVYATPLNPTFTAVLSRKATLAEFLQFLQSTESIHFETAGKKVTVVP